LKERKRVKINSTLLESILTYPKVPESCQIDTINKSEGANFCKLVILSKLYRLTHIDVWNYPYWLICLSMFLQNCCKGTISNK